MQKYKYFLIRQIIICIQWVLQILYICRVPSGRRHLVPENHGTAPSACTVFLRDFATSRHSSNKFGSALDFRNVIHIAPRWDSFFLPFVQGFTPLPVVCRPLWGLLRHPCQDPVQQQTRLERTCQTLKWQPLKIHDNSDL